MKVKFLHCCSCYFIEYYFFMVFLSLPPGSNICPCKNSPDTEVENGLVMLEVKKGVVVAGMTN